MIAIIHIYVLISTLSDGIFDIIQGYVFIQSIQYNADADIFIFIATWFGAAEEFLDFMEDILSLLFEECCLEICQRIALKLFCFVLLLMVMTEQCFSLYITLLLLSNTSSDNLTFFIIVTLINVALILMAVYMAYILYFRFNVFERIVSLLIHNHLIIARNEIKKLESCKSLSDFHKFHYVILNEGSVLTIKAKSKGMLLLNIEQQLIMKKGSKITVTGLGSAVSTRHYGKVCFDDTMHEWQYGSAGTKVLKSDIYDIGNGGGILCITAPIIQMEADAVIESNGGSVNELNWKYYKNNGGSGGSIRINTDNLKMETSARIQAVSGTPHSNPSSNHGVIAIYHKNQFNMDQFYRKAEYFDPLPYFERVQDGQRNICSFNTSNCVNILSGVEYVVSGDLILDSNVILSVSNVVAGKLLLTVEGDLIMKSGSKITVTGKGYRYGQGPSAGTSVDANYFKSELLEQGNTNSFSRGIDIYGYWFAGGAGHATEGQNGWKVGGVNMLNVGGSKRDIQSGKTLYGTEDLEDEMHFGSGGGYVAKPSYATHKDDVAPDGGNGGGIIVLDVRGNLVMGDHCEISANGQRGQRYVSYHDDPHYMHGGSGSGGSILIYCQDIKQGYLSKICADGGPSWNVNDAVPGLELSDAAKSGSPLGSGGGKGRILIKRRS